MREPEEGRKMRNLSTGTVVATHIASEDCKVLGLLVFFRGLAKKFVIFAQLLCLV